MENKQAILVQKDGKTVKWFKVWTKSNPDKARVLITGKDNTGKKYSVEKKFVGVQSKVAMIMACEAVVKYWTKFDPQKHDMACSSGHTDHVGKKKRKVKK